jgi:hypothetical protein
MVLGVQEISMPATILLDRVPAVAVVGALLKLFLLRPVQLSLLL